MLQEPEEEDDAGGSEELDFSLPLRIGDAFYLPETAKAPRNLVLSRVRPRSARHVGSVEWSWGPAHERRDHLYLSLDRSRKFYLLWLEWADGEFPETHAIAFVPRAGLDERAAATALLIAGYRGQEAEYQSESGPWSVCSEGLLSREEIASIRALIWPEGHSDRDNASVPISSETNGSPPAESAFHGSVLDELTLAEVVLRREGQRALSGAVFGIGSAFMRAAQAVEACIAVVTSASSRAEDGARMMVAHAACHALEELANLEKFFPPSPSRFDSVVRALEKLT